MYYLFGTLLTHYGSASLNHGQRKGNISPLHKCQWYDKLHSTVNSDAIRWALRYYWQQKGYPVNRIWDVDCFVNRFTNENFDPIQFIDDDVLGYMKPEAAMEDFVEEESSSVTQPNPEEILEKGSSTQPKPKGRNKPKGNSLQRMGALGINRVISLIPYNGTMTFNSKSGEKDRTSLHFLEYHNTHYQYVFALDTNHLKDKSRIFAVIDALMSIRKVGGHNNVSCYDFSPESFVLRWTQKISPQIFYCFEQSQSKPEIKSDLIEEIKVGDINAKELWIGGKVVKNTKVKGAHIFQGKEQSITNLKQVITKDLNLSIPQK
jgi:CRISPR-associated protein Cst2